MAARLMLNLALMGLCGGAATAVWVTVAAAPPEHRLALPTGAPPAEPRAVRAPRADGTAPERIAARPLFAEDRRPPSTGTAAPAAAVPPPAVTLTGLFGMDGRQGATLRLGRGGTDERVPLGGEIAGWRLAEVGEGRITLERDGRRVTALIGEPLATAAGTAGVGAPSAMRASRRPPPSRPRMGADMADIID